MRLEAFRVSNFKKVDDTEWVACDRLTTLVGKNEAGKSAVLRGLSKLNPASGEGCDGLREFPRRRYAAEFGANDWPVAAGRFVLDDDERRALVHACPALGEVPCVEVTRLYSGALEVSFGWLSAGEAALAAVAAEETTDVRPDMAALAAITASGDWDKVLEPLLAGGRPAAPKPAARVPLPGDGLDAAKRWVLDRMPRFLYFAQFDVIDGAVHIPGFLERLENESTEKGFRSTRALFDLVGLDLKRLADLGPAGGGDPETRRMIDERGILAATASVRMTELFSEWWESRGIRFRYQIDGEHFRIWVSDEIDHSEVELDQRSEGLQYFFSFFAVFLAESRSAHANCILLLDEPGLHLHGAAQKHLLGFLRRLSARNQILYTTHSPFMVAPDDLAGVRVVHEGDKGVTQISKGPWAPSSEALLTLSGAWAYRLAEAVLTTPRALLLHDMTDLALLRTLERIVMSHGGGRLRADVTILPAGDFADLVPLAGLFGGKSTECAFVVGGDGVPGGQPREQVNPAGTRCLSLGSLLGLTEAGLEDFFIETEYLDAAREVYPGVDLPAGNGDSGVGLVSKIETHFRRKGLGAFERWRVAAVLRDRMVDGTVASAETVDRGVRLIKAANGLFGPPSTRRDSVKAPNV